MNLIKEHSSNSYNQKEFQLAIFDSILKSQPDIIIFSLDKNYCYTYFNEKHREEMKKIWGVHITLGMDLLNCLENQELKDLTKKSIDRAISGESFTEIQYQPEQQIFYEYVWNPVLTNNQVLGVTAFIRDITDRKQNEKLLTDIEAKYRSLFENMLEAFGLHEIICDNNGNPVDYRFLAVNPAFEKLTGLDGRLIIGKTVLEVMPETEKHWIETYGKVALSGKSITIENYSKELDRYYRVIAFSQEKGKFATVFEDITDRKRIETSLKEAEQKYTKIFLNSPVSIALTSVEEGQYIEVNDTFQNVFGYKREELIGKTSLEIGIYVHPHQREQLVSSAKKQNGIINQELHFNAKNGNTVIGMVSTVMTMLNNKPYLLSTIIDITSRKKTEEQLGNINQRLNALISSMTAGVLTVSADGCVEQINQSFCDLFELKESPADLVGLSSPEMIKKLLKCYADPEDALSRIQKILADSKRITGEEIRMANGRFFVVDFIPIIADGKKNGHIWYHYDITNRKTDEEILKNSEKRLHDIIFSTADWIWEVDENGVYTYSSEKDIELFGLTSDEIIGKTPFDLMPPEEAVRVGNIFSKIIANKAPIKDLENWNINKNGDRICLLTNGVPIIDSSGNFKGYRGIDKNITAQKLAEVILKESEEKFKLAFMTISDAVYLSTLEEGLIIEANNSFKDVFGYSAEEAIGRTSLELNLYYNPDDRKKVVEGLKANGQIRDIELQGRKKGGEVFFCSLSMSVLTINNKLHILGVTRDVTARKTTEEEIKQNAKHSGILVDILQHKNETVHDFLDYALDKAIELTNSKIGYIYHYNEEKKEFVLNSWSKEVMSACNITEKQTIYELDKTGIWGEAVRQRKAIMVNDFRSPHPLKKGYPEGHAELSKYLTLPVFNAEQIVGVIAVANKQTDYSETDVLQLQLFIDVVWKVVERMRTEELLRESEMKFRQTFDLSPIGTVMVGLDKRFIRCNNSFSQTLGYQPEELVGKTIAEVTFPDDIELGMAEMAAIAKGELESTHIQKRFLCKNGQIIWGDVTISFVNGIAGDPKHTDNKQYFLGIIEDITEHKKVIEALQESEDKFKYLFDHSVIGKSITLPTGDINVNMAFCKMTGYSPEELQNKKWQDITHPDDIELTNNEINTLLSGEKSSVRFVKRYINKNGSVIWSDVGSALRRDNSGNLLYYITAVNDISDRVNAENALRKSEKKYRALHESMMDGFVSVDLNGKILESNVIYRNMLGYNETELAELTYVNLTPEKWHSFEKEIVETQILKRGYSDIYQKEYIRKDGTIFPVELHTVLVRDDDGNPSMMWAIARDITERLKDEAKRTLFSSVLEKSVNEIYIFNADTLKFISVNKGARDNIGYSMEELQQMTPLNIKPEYNEIFFRNSIQPLISGESELLNYKTIHRRKNGSEYPVDVYLSFHHEDNLFVAIIMDITERKKAEDALIENEKLLRESQKAARIGSYVWDLKTGFWKSSKVLDDIFGIGPSYKRSLEGWVQLIHPEWQSIMADYVANEVVAKKQKFDKEYMIIRQNDRMELWVHGIGELEFNSDNHSAKLTGTITDITDQKLAKIKIEEQLEELRRWYEVTLDREGRILELKKEINELLKQSGKEIRYKSANTNEIDFK
jgi:PAS domain S-box-containing protein